MKRINRVVSSVKRKSSGGKGQTGQLERLLSSPSILSFREEHPEVPQDVYRRSLLQLRQLVKERANCEKCPGLEHCPNLIRGHRTQMALYGGYLDFRMQPCDPFLIRERDKKRKQLIKSHHIPPEIMKATFSSITPNPGRMEAIRGAIRFCQRFGEKRSGKGLYFYGGFGVGKSRIVAGIAQELVDYDVDSLMVYVPDFIREIKESIKEGLVQEKLAALKRATVLILDDIGAETLTPWTRDEVMGALLQYRMAEELPTVMTSNLDLDELEDHFAYSDKGGTERIKAKRIMERIRPFVEVHLVEGPNWREAGSD